MSQSFDEHLSAFAAEAEQMFGTKPVVATLSDHVWLRRLAPLAHLDGGTACVPDRRASDRLLGIVDDLTFES